jgi:hypothetical protein
MVFVGRDLTYVLPDMEDAEFLPIKVKALLLTGKTSTDPLPPFIKLQGGKQLYFNPTHEKNKGIYKIQVELDDGHSEPNKYKFAVNVSVESVIKTADKKKGFQVSKA